MSVMISKVQCPRNEENQPSKCELKQESPMGSEENLESNDIWTLEHPDCSLAKSKCQKVNRRSLKGIVFVTIIVLWKLALIFVLSIWLSTIFFMIFVYFYQPDTDLHTFPVPFYFKENLQGSRNSSLIGKVLFRPRGDLRPLLIPHQPYEITLLIRVPQSPTNAQVGMFMVCLSLTDKQGKLSLGAQSPRKLNNLAQFYAKKGLCKHTMLRFQSGIRTYILSLVQIALSGFTNVQEANELLLTFDTAFEDDPEFFVVEAEIRIDNRLVQIYEAELILSTEFRGLQRLLFYHPIATFLMWIPLNFFWITFVLLCSLFPFGNTTFPLGFLFSSPKEIND